MIVTLGAFAQDADQSSGGNSFGVVIYAEGDVVSVIRDLRRTEYDAFTGELLGLAVYPGDIIQKDPNTYVEIQLLPSRSVIKVAENTSFTVEQISATGDGVFNLAYGRLRARVNRLTGVDPFQIRGIGATAGVRGTDFGADVIAQPAGGASLTRIYCFEGEVQVEMDGLSSEQPSEAEPIVLTANEMITAITLSPTSAAAIAAEPEPESDGEPVILPAPVAEIEPILPAISEFWQRENFVAEPGDAESVLAQFPDLRTDATERLGDLLFLQTDEVPEPSPMPEAEPISTQPAVDVPEAVEATPIGDEPRAAEAVAIEGDSEIMDPERRERMISATKVTGLAVTGLGLLAEATAATLFFWGDQIFPSWPAASDAGLITPIVASGGVFVIGGIFSLLLSLQLSR